MDIQRARSLLTRPHSVGRYMVLESARNLRQHRAQYGHRYAITRLGTCFPLGRVPVVEHPLGNVYEVKLCLSPREPWKACGRLISNVVATIQDRLGLVTICRELSQVSECSDAASSARSLFFLDYVSGIPERLKHSHGRPLWIC